MIRDIKEAYPALKDPFFEEYFGFTEEEVETLCQKQTALTMNEIRDWYNGYQMKDGTRLCNPRSVVCALEGRTCQSYWTETGKMNETLFFLKYNISEMRDDVVKMVNSIPIAYPPATSRATFSRKRILLAE